MNPYRRFTPTRYGDPQHRASVTACVLLCVVILATAVLSSITFQIALHSARNPTDSAVFFALGVCCLGVVLAAICALISEVRA